MPGRSDSDSSPDSPSSSDSSSSGEEVKPTADPGSPSHAQQSSDEGGSSDGVLVELPGPPDQVLASGSFLISFMGSLLNWDICVA